MKRVKRVDTRATANDVSVWGDAPTASYPEPFKVNGEVVDLDKLPAFGEEPRKASSDDSGARAPLRRGS